MKRKLVYVRWRDACSEDCYLYDKDVESYKPLTTVETAGLFIEQNKTALVLAQDRMDEQGKWRTIYTIPVENIIKKKVVTVDV